MKTCSDRYALPLGVAPYLLVLVAVLLIAAAPFVFSLHIAASLFNLFNAVCGGAMAWLGIVHLCQIRENKLQERERLQAAAALQKSEERFRSLVETSSDLIWEVDVEFVYTYVSPKIRDILGYEPDEVIGKKTPFDLMPPGERERIAAICREAMYARKPLVSLENVNLHKDGRRVILETGAVPIFSVAGELAGTRGIDRDITERKKAEDALRESEEWFRNIFDEGPVGMVVADRDFHYIRVNAAFCRMLGYTADELLSRSAEDITHPDQVSYNEEYMKRLLTGEQERYCAEKRYITRNGEVVWGQLTMSVIRDRNGDFRHFVGMVENINERKKAEEALRESMDRYRNIVSNAPFGIFHTTINGKVIDVNDALVRMCGYDSQAEFIAAVNRGSGIIDHLYADPRQRSVLMEELRASVPGWHRYELLYRRKDGQSINVSARFCLFSEPDSSGAELEGVVEDITERKKAEEALRESEEGFVTLYRNIPVMMTVSSLGEGRFMEVNNYFEKFTGYTREEALGRTVIDLNFFHDYGERERFLKSVCGAPTLQNQEFRYRARNGEMRIGLVSGILTQFRKQAAVVMILSDITDRSRTEKELENYREKLRLLANELTLVEERERRRIATDIHDYVGQALAMARLRLGTLKKADIPEVHRHTLEGTCQLLDQGIQYTRSLMFELSPPVLYELGFVPALEWLAEQMQTHHGLVCTVVARAAHISLEVELKSVLFKVVRELLMNVVKHSGATAANVTIAEDNGTVTVTVEDSGRGFNADEVQRRLHTGGGFGLFSIRERMSYMKGRVDIISEPGRGTCVRLSVPLNGEGKGKI